MTTEKNIILGAGLAGLSTAYHLDGDYEIYEKNSKAGGVCGSVNVDGYIFDHGPHILYPETQYGRELIGGLLKNNLLVRKRRAGIYHKKYDLYTKFPFQAHLYGLPVQVVVECLDELHKSLADKNRPKPDNYEQWMYARFGRGISEHLMVPYARKIWTVEPCTMNYEWINRRVPEPDFEVILEGALTETGRRVGANKDFWYPIEGGIESLPASFLPKIKDVNYNMEAVRIRPVEKVVDFADGTTVPYGRLISTLPLPQVIGMIKEVPEEVRKAVESLQHNSILCVNIGVDREEMCDYHWLYFYEDEFVFHRINFPRKFSPNTVPSGKSSISCEVAYSKNRPVEKHNIIERTVDDLIKAKLLRNSDTITVSQVLDLEVAYVIYDLNHRKNVGTVHNYLRSIDVYPCGRFGEWEYFNMDHTILSGQRTANEINALAAKSASMRADKYKVA